MSRQAPRSTAVRSYYLYRATDSVGFIWPVFTLFLLWNDLAFTQIGTLGAVSAVLVVAFEVPTGYVADRFGRRNALALGMTAMAVSIGGFVFVDSFAGFVVLYAIWSIALSVRSGTSDAWLYETLRDRMDERSFTRVRGRGGSVHHWVSAVTMIAGGFLYAAHPTYPFIASAVLHGAGVVVVLSMPKNGRYEGSIAGEAGTGVRGSLALLRTQFSRPSLRTFVPFVALFFAIVNVADTYVQPITVSALDAIDVAAPIGGAIPEAAMLGVIYAGFAVLAAVASYHAETIRTLFGLRTALLAVPVATATLFLAAGITPLVAIPVFFAMKGAGALYEPLVNQYLNGRIESVGRATLLSTASMGYALVRAPLKPLAGYLADLTSPIALLGVLGGAFVSIALVLVAVATPIPADGGADSPDPSADVD
ncbi:MFS transporter [Halosolutus gelatinilyticus]|uniref:MFS transporter n=1 Tax=Halosolutus gelatinilyticus TaxID=2931975 RepID=UPI001FF34A68|nr:MFS transporter [Halosolutus gelatinilyticus]